jgi:hypothetical protein
LSYSIAASKAQVCIKGIILGPIDENAKLFLASPFSLRAGKFNIFENNDHSRS